MELKIVKDIDELSERLAEWVSEYIKKILRDRKRFTLALSGGGTPKKLNHLLTSENFKNKIEWDKIHFFWGDERYVPFTDDRNNAKMAFDTLLDHVPIKKDQIYIMRTDIDLETSVREYEKLLHQFFPDKNHTFDLVLLGLGDNAHTLSLFPENPLIDEREKWVSSFYLEQEKIFRITLTPPVVNAAGCVAFLVSGKSKTAALYNVLTKEYNPKMYPAQAIQPFNDELYWWVDEDVAEMVK